MNAMSLITMWGMELFLKLITLTDKLAVFLNNTVSDLIPDWLPLSGLVQNVIDNLFGTSPLVMILFSAPIALAGITVIRWVIGWITGA